MVRSAEWPGGHQWLAGLQQAKRAVDPRGFDRLRSRERWEDRGNALREHRLAATRRPDHRKVVATRRSHADRPFRCLLAANVGEVDVVGGKPIEPLIHAGRSRRDIDFASKKLHRLGE